MLALLAFLAVTGFGRDALANSYSFCLSMDTDYENVGFGEDYIVGAAGPYTARYIKVKVTKGAEVIVDTTYANQSGCVSFTHGTTGQFKLEVWGEMRIPRTDNAANNNTVRILNSSGNQPYWNYFLDLWGDQRFEVLHAAAEQLHEPHQHLPVGLRASQRRVDRQGQGSSRSR